MPGRVGFACVVRAAAALAVGVAVAGACAAQGFDLAPYRLGMAKAQAKAVGYANCSSREPTNPKASVECEASKGLRFMPGAKVRLVFGGPSVSEVTRIDVATTATVAQLVAQMSAVAPPLKGGKRETVFIDRSDVVARVRDQLVGERTVSFGRELGAHKRQAAAEAKDKAGERRLKDF